MDNGETVFTIIRYPLSIFYFAVFFVKQTVCPKFAAIKFGKQNSGNTMSILSQKYLPPFLGIATLTWIVVGTYWFKNQFWDVPTSVNTTTPVNGAVHLPFYFPMGIAQPIFTSESFSMFKKTTNYLNDNPNKKLMINGLYAFNEVPNQKPSKLGEQRAEAIKSVLIHLGAESKRIQTKAEQRDNLYFFNQQLYDGVEFKIVDSPEGRFEALNLFFQPHKYLFAENDDLKKYFTALNEYITLHPNVKLKITAHQDKTEGDRASKKRLAYMQLFLEKHGFLPKQFEFEDVKDKKPLAEAGQIKNRRVEIRLIVP